MAIKKLENKVIRVRKFEVKGEEQLNKLNDVQNKACKDFDIKPHKEFRYFITINYYGSNKIIKGDLLSDTVGRLYSVIEVEGLYANIFNVNPMTSHPNIHGALKIEGREVKKQVNK